MSGGLTLIGGIGFGAGLMYLLDPHGGRRRRALVRDQVAHVLYLAGDLSQRVQGFVAELSSRLSSQPVPDAVLVARVRSKIGHVTPHPSSIEVTVDHGHVTLRGPILAHEVDDLLAAVSAVRGVTAVGNQLEVHEQAGEVPGLQGEAAQPGERFEVLQTKWSPAAQHRSAHQATPE